jgi:hypothetical protein
MSRKLIKGIIALVILLVANVGIFTIGHRFLATFWISYIFAMIAALLTVYVEIFYAMKEKLIFRYPISAVTFFYLAVELVAAFICTNFFSFWVMFSFLLQLFILAAYIVAFFSVMLHNQTTKEQQEVRGRDIVNFKYIVESMNGVINKMPYSHPKRKLVQHACDALASGQVRSDKSVYDLEQQILSAISGLEQAVKEDNSEKIENLCREIENAADERKRRLSQRAPF